MKSSSTSMMTDLTIITAHTHTHTHTHTDVHLRLFTQTPLCSVGANTSASSSFLVGGWWTDDRTKRRRRMRRRGGKVKKWCGRDVVCWNVNFTVCVSKAKSQTERLFFKKWHSNTWSDLLLKFTLEKTLHASASCTWIMAEVDRTRSKSF